MVYINNIDSETENKQQNKEISLIVSSTNNGIMSFNEQCGGIIKSITQMSAILGLVSKDSISLFNSTVMQNVLGLASVIQKSYDVKSISESMNRIVAIYSFVTNDFASKLIKAINFIPFKSIAEVFKNLGYDIQLDEYERIYCSVMYNVKWLPYLDFVSEYDLFMSLNKIIATSRYGSKRQIKRIDKAIIDYYSGAKIKKIKSEWLKFGLEKHYEKMLSHAVNAYLRKEYILTICCLATLWETLLFKFEEKQRHNSTVIKEKFNELSKYSGDEKITDFLNDFFGNIIMGQCNGIEDVNEDIPNRHGIAHGWWNKYPSKKSALNAILLTDLILKL